MSMPALAQVPAKRGRAVLVAVMAFGLTAWTGVALAQTERPPAAEPPPAQLQAAPQAEPKAPLVGGGGLLERLGELIRDSAEGVSSGLKGTQQRIDDINKGTIDTLSRIPVAGFATGRSLCPRAANGAPDCYAATDKLCKDKGYTAGRSLDTESAETCNPRIYLPGYQRKEGDCRTETFVTRAACQ
jgi:hypothetical protein